MVFSGRGTKNKGDFSLLVTFKWNVRLNYVNVVLKLHCPCLMGLLRYVTFVPRFLL